MRDVPPVNPSLLDVAQRRLKRRDALKTMVGSAAAATIPGWLLNEQARAAALTGRHVPNVAPPEGGGMTGSAAGASTLTFTEIDSRAGITDVVAPGYRKDVLIRWGDPVLPGAPPYRAGAVDPEGQALQFGYNCDFTAYMPLPRGSQNSEHGLLCVNHEYTSPELMWAGVGSQRDLHREQARVEMLAHGHSVIEVKKSHGRWSVVPDSLYARRITGWTQIRISGPAAGHARLRTREDASGRWVFGTLNNCAGGVTPWGTVLMAEENFNKYFGGPYGGTEEERNYARYTLGASTLEYGWHWHWERFSIPLELNEANRFGWIVEFDPYDAKSVPVKRTALGRFKHEGATCIVNRDGRVVLYSGDDEANEYVYRFVTNGRLDPEHPVRNRELLDDGVLSVARFNEDGTLTWLPLVWKDGGGGPLSVENGFHSQADVVIECRRAADLVGATPMDRPEDVEPNPVTGSVFVMLTSNPKRPGEKVHRANPRAANHFGHIIEMTPPGGKGAEADHAADTFTWSLFLLAGDPSRPEHGAVYHPAVSRNGWLAGPDNCAFDHKGRLWVATDHGLWNSDFKLPDGIWATDVTGEGRALTKLFYAVPIGAELCGPCFTPDGKTLFLSVQHPGEGTRYEQPATRWPDFQEGIPPRPSVVVITREDGGEIGG